LERDRTEEGKFDFRDFDRILLRARAEGFRVDLLWFGTWKNGAMDWAPNWVKTDTARFPRVLDSGGKPIRVLSPHSGPRSTPTSGPTWP